MTCDSKKKKALETAVDQYHKWDDMVFKGIDGVPPLVNVEMSAYTMDFFMRENKLLQLLFTSEPKNASLTNTNMATVLYDKNKLVGIAIEYGDNDRAYVSMDKLDRDKFVGLADWQENPALHAAEMRARISAYTGRDIGLIKCADLNGFFGGLNKVVENPNTLEMLLEGVKFAANCVTYGSLSIQPEPKFFSYMRMLNKLTDKMDVKKISGAAMALGSVYDSCRNLAEKVNLSLPEGVTMGLVLQNKEKEFAAVELYAKQGNLRFKDFGNPFPVVYAGQKLNEAARDVHDVNGQNLTIGLSTDFLYNAMKSALTYSPLKLGYSVAKAAAKGELVVC